MNWTKAQWRILIVAWLGWVFDIMDAALFNFAKVPMLTAMLGEAEYARIGAALEGRIQSVFLFGWAVGGLIFGILADRWGRLRTLTVTILVYSVFTGLTALCQTPEQVMAARFVTALGIGGEWAAGAALVAEAFRHVKRGPASAVLQSAAAFGPALAAGASLILRHESWHWLFVVGVFPALVTVGLRFAVKSEETITETSARDAGSPIALLRHPVYGKRAIVATIIGAVGVIGAGTATYWMPNLVKAASTGLPTDEVTARTAYVTWVSHIGTLLGVICVPWLAERWGRRRTIALFFVLAPLVVLLAVGSGATYGRLLALSPLINFFAIGISAAFVLYFPELFPGKFRAIGSGLAYNTGRLLAIPMPAITGQIAAAGSAITQAVVLSGTVYLIGLIAIPFAPETRGLALPEDD